MLIKQSCSVQQGCQRLLYCRRRAEAYLTRNCFRQISEEDSTSLRAICGLLCCRTCKQEAVWPLLII